MQINSLNLMQDVSPGAAQIKQHYQTLQKKQKALSHYPKTIQKIREFKSAYPLVQRYISKYASEESIDIGPTTIKARYFNDTDKAKKLIVFFPGGNFCFDQQYDYDLLCESFINDHVQLLIMPPTLAPESIFPAAHEKALQLISHIMAHQQDYMPSSELIFAATGSGCHIANWVYHHLPDQEMVKKMILIDGLYQITALSSTNALQADSISGALNCYFVDQIHSNPFINQIQHFQPYHMPILFVSGSHHSLCGETIQMAAMSSFNCKDIDLLTVPGAIHEFLMYDGTQQKEALRLINEWAYRE